MTPERIAEIRRKPHGPDVADLMDTVEQLRAENDRLRRSVLNQCGDNLCHLTDAEVTELSAHPGRIPPWSEFSQSCQRFHTQIAALCGEIQGCMTIAQLEAELEKGRGAIKAMSSQLRMGIEAMKALQRAEQDSVESRDRIAQLEGEKREATEALRVATLCKDRLRAAIRYSAERAFSTLLHRQREWSLAIFGPSGSFRNEQILAHLRKELAEIEAEPADLVEWCDLILLACDGYWRNGGQPEHLMRDLLAKQAINRERKWARTDEGTMEHVREVENVEQIGGINAVKRA